MKKFQSLGRSLSKNEMKMIVGGVGCSMTYQDSSGVWRTEYGSCAVYGTTFATEFAVELE